MGCDVHHDAGGLSEIPRSFGAASGFQSYQYRLVEFMMGAKDPKMVLPHRHNPPALAMLNDALKARSIYDEALALLARRGFAIPANAIERDFATVRPFDPAVRDLWATIYRQSERYFDLYQLAEELVDLEDWFQQWRFRHMKTVERIIGFKKGSEDRRASASCGPPSTCRFFRTLGRAHGPVTVASAGCGFARTGAVA